MSLSMIVVPPVTITDSSLTSTTVSENDYTAWNGATAYSIGDHVIRTATHRIYERLTNGTTATAPESDTTNWLDIAPTNAWAMFDATVSTGTSASGTIEVVLEPGRIDTLSVLDVEANSVTVEMETTLGGTIYSKTTTMLARETSPTSWWEYFTAGFQARGSYVFADLPITSEGVVTVTIDGGSGTAVCGTLSCGLSKAIGRPIAGPRASIVDYSRKDTDAFGNTTLVQRAYAKKYEIRLVLTAAEQDAVFRRLALLRATPAMWIVSSNIEMLTAFGFYRDFSIELAYATHSICTLTIEGLA